MKKLRHTRTAPLNFRVEKRIDRYVYVDVSIGYSPSPLPYYWRLDVPAHNLIEVGIERTSGRLMSITVPLYNGALHQLRQNVRSKCGRNYYGVPEFDLSLWDEKGAHSNSANNLYDVQGRCRFELGKNSLRILLFPDSTSYCVTSGDELICEFNQDQELIAVALPKVNPNERSILEMISKRHSTA